MKEAMSRLSPAESFALTARYWGNCSHRETAMSMGRSEGAVKTLIHHGLVDLRDRFGKILEEAK